MFLFKRIDRGEIYIVTDYARTFVPYSINVVNEAVLYELCVVPCLANAGQHAASDAESFRRNGSQNGHACQPNTLP